MGRHPGAHFADGLLLEPIDIANTHMAIRERWGVLMLLDDPLAARDSLTAEELARLPLILPRRALVLNELNNWFGAYAAGLQNKISCNLSTNAAVMVQNKQGNALAVEGSIPFWDRDKITFRPLSPALFSTSVLAWKKAQPFSAAATKFIAFIRTPSAHSLSGAYE